MLPVLLCLALATPLQRDPVRYGSESFAPFDPRAWTSPSGHWTLELDPSRVTGKGPAHYLLRHGDETAWEGERPFTLLRAEVGDEGEVVGYALVGSEGRNERIHLTAIASDGKDRWGVEIQRGPTRAMHSPPHPVPRAFAYDGPGDRIGLRLYEYTEDFKGGTWRFYRASTGEHLGTWKDGEGNDAMLDAGATPDLRRDFLAAEQEWAAEWAGPALAPRPAPAPPLLSTTLIAEVPLEHDGLEPRKPASVEYGRMYFVSIDPTGKLLALDRESTSLHAWNAEGKRLFSASPDDEDAPQRIDEVIALPDGDLLARVEDERCVRFDENGVRVGPLELPLEHAVFPAGGKGAWAWRGHAPPRWVPQGTSADAAEVVIERLPDRRWVWSVDCAAPLDDGGIAVVARGELVLYSPDGTADEMIRLATKQKLAGAGDFRSLRMVGGRAVAVTWNGEAVVVDRAAKRVRSVMLPEWVRCAGLSPDGKELWTLDDKALVLRRFELP